ncbi:hypothetical protein RTM1035_05000 [Roseovarius sp. TM1035]|jgi:hypothetical protein|nr:hypothetical protein RTM1035_05000 [Roseovarius sp. TM1035]
MAIRDCVSFLWDYPIHADRITLPASAPGARRHRRNPLHIPALPEPHVDEPVQSGAGVDEGVEGRFAFAVALWLAGADRAAALEAAESTSSHPFSPKQPFASPKHNVGFGPDVTVAIFKNRLL